MRGNHDKELERIRTIAKLHIKSLAEMNDAEARKLLVEFLYSVSDTLGDIIYERKEGTTGRMPSLN